MGQERVVISRIDRVRHVNWVGLDFLEEDPLVDSGDSLPLGLALIGDFGALDDVAQIDGRIATLVVSASTLQRISVKFCLGLDGNRRQHGHPRSRRDFFEPLYLRTGTGSIDDGSFSAPGSLSLFAAAP